MPDQPHPTQSNKPEIGSRWRVDGLRGTWRVDAAGRKWVTLRSETVVLRGGAWASQKVLTETWPGDWRRA